MSPTLAIAQKDLLARDKGALFWACLALLAFGVASLASGRFLRRARARTERRLA
jgi:hypothetical protein